MKRIWNIFISVLLLGTLVLSASCTSGKETAADIPEPLKEETVERTEAFRMYEEAKGEGYEGSYLQFLADFDFTEKEGADPVQTSLRSVVRVVSTFTRGTGRFATSFTSSGAGIVWSYDEETGDMVVVTNYHVVYSAPSTGTTKRISDDISLWLYGGSSAAGEITASYVGGAMAYDVAVLFVEGSDTVTTDSGAHTNFEAEQKCVITPARFADSDTLLVGERVYAVGNPNAEGIAVSEGIVSVDAEYVTMTSLDGTSTEESLEIRTDAAVNHGNSGGGLFNGRGALVGLVNARSEEDGVEAFGYAIPSNLVSAIVRNLLFNDGTVRRAMLGITCKSSQSGSVLDGDAVRIREDIFIDSVDSGVSTGKLMAGDQLLSVTVGGKTVSLDRYHQLTTALFDVRLGDSVVLTILRGSEEKTIELSFSQDSFFTVYN